MKNLLTLIVLLQSVSGFSACLNYKLSDLELKSSQTKKEVTYQRCPKSSMSFYIKQPVTKILLINNKKEIGKKQSYEQVRTVCASVHLDTPAIVNQFIEDLEMHKEHYPNGEINICHDKEGRLEIDRTPFYAIADEGLGHDLHSELDELKKKYDKLKKALDSCDEVNVKLLDKIQHFETREPNIVQSLEIKDIKEDVLQSKTAPQIQIER